MTVNKHSSKKRSKRIDPDEAPELTMEKLRQGVWSSGATPLRSMKAAVGQKVALVPMKDPKTARAAFKKAMGRPIGSGKKEQITLRLDRESLDRFKATGAGWQTRIDTALKSWLKRHDPAKL